MAYRWVGAVLVIGCVVVGFFLPLVLTAAIVTCLGALAVLLGSAMQAAAAYVIYTTAKDGSQPKSWLGRAIASFFNQLFIYLFQLHGWILVLSGSMLFLAGAIMTAVTLA
jgi:hypothetical protein